MRHFVSPLSSDRGIAYWYQSFRNLFATIRFVSSYSFTAQSISRLFTRGLPLPSRPGHGHLEPLFVRSTIKSRSNWPKRPEDGHHGASPCGVALYRSSLQADQLLPFSKRDRQILGASSRAGSFHHHCVPIGSLSFRRFNSDDCS